MLFWGENVLITAIPIEATSPSAVAKVRPNPPIGDIMLTFATRSGPVGDLVMLVASLIQISLSPRIQLRSRVAIATGKLSNGDHICESITFLDGKAVKG
jgi:hypothetical protein